jgi:hypothetical protein
MTSLAFKLVHERVGISDVDYPESACCKHVNGSVESRTSSADEGAASSLFTLRYIVFIGLRYSVGSRVWDSSSCSYFDYHSNSSYGSLQERPQGSRDHGCKCSFVGASNSPERLNSPLLVEAAPFLKSLRGTFCALHHLKTKCVVNEALVMRWKAG